MTVGEVVIKLKEFDQNLPLCIEDMSGENPPSEVTEFVIMDLEYIQTTTNKRVKSIILVAY